LPRLCVMQCDLSTGIQCDPIAKLAACTLHIIKELGRVALTSHAPEDKLKEDCVQATSRRPVYAECLS